MYEFFFGFKEKPFSITPDPKFLYLSKKHREALAGLIYGMKGRRGLVVLSGELGTGKTTLIKGLSEKLDQSSQVACIFNPELSVLGFFMTICEDFGIPVRGPSRMNYLTKLHDFLIESQNKGKTTSLIFDEAQNLDPSLFEEIRMLTNLETSNEKLLQIFLVGEPELDDLLSQRQLWKLKQRISIRYSLLPLDHEETRGYIETRLRVAGAKRQNCFTEGAILKIYEHSGGVPLRINNICEDSLLLGYTLGAPIINKEIVTKCIAGITPGAVHKTAVPKSPDIRSRPEEKSYPRASSTSMPYLIILIGFLVVGIALLVLAMFDPAQRLLKPFETVQSFFHREQKPAAEDARLAKQESIEDTTAGPLVAMKAETAPESEIVKTSPDTVSEEESIEEPGETELSQAEAGPDGAATLLSTVEGGDRVDEVTHSESGTVYALDQIQTDQTVQLAPDVRPTDSVPEEEIQEEEGDILLGVERAGEDRLASSQGTVEFDFPAEETPQEEAPETVARPDQSFRTEEEILIEIGEIKAPDMMVEEDELTEPPSVGYVLESEPGETMEPLSAEPSEVTPRKPTAGERSPDEDIGDERLGQVPIEEDWQEEVTPKPPSDTGGIQEGLDARELAGIENRGPAKPPATEVSKEAEEKSLEDSQKAALEEELRGDKDLVRIEEKEVRQFFANYLERYNRKDIGGFLSLFSRRAIQNGKDGFSKIEKMYSDFFDQSQELRYHLEEVRIEIHQNVLISGVFFRNAAEVQARYEIDQVLERGRQKNVWKGDISWILRRENGALRVVYLNYQPSKSPSKRKSPATDESR